MTSDELEVAKKVVRRLLNPTPVSERQVKAEAVHMLWAFNLYGYKLVPTDD